MNYKNIYNAIIAYRRSNPINKDPNKLGEVEYHHIIPISCGGENTPRNSFYNHDGTNIVGLTLREHFVVHHLLTKIYKGTPFEMQMNFTWNFMCTRKYKHIASSRMFQAARKQLSLINRINYTNRIWVNNGTKNKFVYPNQIPDGFKPGRLVSPTKGKIRVTNGIIERCVYPDQIPDGFKIGRCIKKQPTKIWVNDGIKNKQVYPDQIPDGFKIGQLKHTTATGKIWITDGIKDMRIAKSDSIPDSFRQGRSIRNKIFVNNGIETRLVAKNHIPEGFVIGKLDYHPGKNTVWVNNGIENKRVQPNEIPVGYELGRNMKLNKSSMI